MASRDLEEAHPYLRCTWADILADYRRSFPGNDLLVTCTYRSPEEQYSLYRKGRTFSESGDVIATNRSQVVTNIDGRSQKSNHNLRPSRAIDFAVIMGGKLTWDVAAYDPVGKLAEARGMVWGGSWKSFKDRPHIELPEWVP